MTHPQGHFVGSRHQHLPTQISLQRQCTGKGHQDDAEQGKARQQDQAGQWVQSVYRFGHGDGTEDQGGDVERQDQ